MLKLFHHLRWRKPRSRLSLKRTGLPASKHKSFTQAFSPPAVAQAALRAFSKKEPGCPRQNIKVLRKLFQKLAGWRGGALPRPSQWAKLSGIPRAQEGRPNRPGDGWAVGNPSEGFPIPTLLCNFLSQLPFFDRLHVFIIFPFAMGIE